MAKSKVAKVTRTFSTIYGGRKDDFSVETTLTDDEAMKLLAGDEDPATFMLKDSFEATCVFEIHRFKHDLRTRPNVLAWAFKLAQDAASGNTTPGKRREYHLKKHILQGCRFRRPISGFVETDDSGLGRTLPYMIQQHGSASQYCGQYTITDGGEYPRNKFYGRADAQGRWTPTNATPAALIKFLTTDKE